MFILGQAVEDLINDLCRGRWSRTRAAAPARCQSRPIVNVVAVLLWMSLLGSVAYGDRGRPENVGQLIAFRLTYAADIQRRFKVFLFAQSVRMNCKIMYNGPYSTVSFWAFLVIDFNSIKAQWLAAGAYWRNPEASTKYSSQSSYRR